MLDVIHSSTIAYFSSFVYRIKREFFLQASYFFIKQIWTNFLYPRTKHIAMRIAHFSASLCNGNTVFGIVANSVFFLGLCIAWLQTTFFMKCTGLVLAAQSIWRRISKGSDYIVLIKIRIDICMYRCHSFFLWIHLNTFSALPFLHKSNFSSAPPNGFFSWTLTEEWFPLMITLQGILLYGIM